MIDKVGQGLAGQCHLWTDGLGAHTNEGWGSQEAQVAFIRVFLPATKTIPIEIPLALKKKKSLS